MPSLTVVVVMTYPRNPDGREESHSCRPDAARFYGERGSLCRWPEAGSRVVMISG
jgi:hypothetical protein